MPNRIYLDHAATTPLRPEAEAAMREGFALWANPSSPHAEGRRARAMLEDARERIKRALGWDGELIFTSGASEALAIAITRCVQPLAAVSAVEHDAVLRRAEHVPRLNVDAFGLVDPATCALAGLVAIQHANNETGVLQRLNRLAPAVRSAGGILLADCAQTAGKVSLPDADLIAISAHKFGGPVGVGALLIKDWALLRPSGGQERGYRGGTENLPGAIAMAAALEAGNGWMAEATRLQSKLCAALDSDRGKKIPPNAVCIPTIGAYRMKGVTANAQLISFDAMGIAVSAGSACSSGSLKSSHVLSAIGAHEANEIIRVSIGYDTTEADIEEFVEAWKSIANRAARAA